MKIREWGLVSLECGGRSVELQEKETLVESGSILKMKDKSSQGQSSISRVRVNPQDER